MLSKSSSNKSCHENGARDSSPDVTQRMKFYFSSLGNSSQSSHFHSQPQSQSGCSSSSAGKFFLPDNESSNSFRVPEYHGYHESGGSLNQESANNSGGGGGGGSNSNSAAFLKMHHLSKYSIQEDRTKFVLVLYCGGTIGMRAKNGVYSPEPYFLEKELRRQPIFHDPHFPATSVLHDKLDIDNLLILPPTNDGQRIVYAVEEYDPLLDSSNMSYDDYVRLAKDISENYKFFDGFVVLHGTDTMAFTASALSFMIENLGKPIIFTGSQIPIFELRSDGRNNFINALILAGTVLIPEVTIFFNTALYRGNRSTKVDNKSLAAFDSPNIGPLVNVEISIKVNWSDVFRSVGMKKFQVSTRMCPNVGVLRLFPNITIETIRSFLRPPMQGVVLQTYGQGNGPDNRLDILKAIKEATDRGVIVVNCTQCSKGIVNPIYAAGKAFFEAGVISGSDMTVEAALMKLSYLLGKEELSLAQRRKLIGLNLRGELSEILNQEDEKVHVSLIENLADVLRLGTGHERHQLEIELFPYLLCLAAHEGSVNTLEKLKKAGAYFNMADYDGRTPLHIASCNGDVDVVRYLLEEGAPVHQRDRFNYSPLDNALQFRQKEIVPLLIKTGAHITVMTPKHINNFISAVLNDDLKVVEMWCDAGADVNMGGFEGRTPLHVAVNFNLIDKVDLLLSRGGNPLVTDKNDRTPLSDAKMMHHLEIVKMMEDYLGVQDEGNESH